MIGGMLLQNKNNGHTYFAESGSGLFGDVDLMKFCLLGEMLVFFTRIIPFFLPFKMFIKIFP